MKTADKRGKEKKNLRDYFELTEQTHAKRQGFCLFVFLYKPAPSTPSQTLKLQAEPKCRRRHFVPVSTAPRPGAEVSHTRAAAIRAELPSEAG